MSYYKENCNLSTFPIHAHFDKNHYKNKKPLPTHNSNVVVEGFLKRIETTPSMGEVSLFHVSVDNLHFLGKAVLSPNNGANQSKSTSHNSINTNAIY
jgi:hypothetical protein